MAVLCLAASASAVATALPGTGCDLTGWWAGVNAVQQTGSVVRVTAGDLGHGSISGYNVTMYFDNMGGSTPLVGALSLTCDTLTWSNAVQWKRPCPDPPGHLAPGARACGTACCEPGHVCDRGASCIIQPVLTKIHVVYMT